MQYPVADNIKALTLAGWKGVEERRNGGPVQATQAAGLPRSPLKKLCAKI
jgi:hypothetical protein